ncbi:MAG: AI-2E family transporter [archaeon]
MVTKEKDRVPSKYVFIALLLILAYLFFRLVQPFFTYVLLGIIFTVALSPLHLLLCKVFKNNKVSSLFTVLLVLLVVIIPSFFIVGSLVKETTNFFSSIDSDSFNQVNDYAVAHLGPRADLKERLGQALVNIEGFLLSSALQIAGSVADILIGLLIMFSIMYHGFVNGEHYMKNISEVMPFSKSRREKLMDKIRKVTKSVIYGEVLIALVQGTLGALGFFIAGIGNPVFWGFIMAILAFLPFVSSGLIWLPAALIMISQHQVVNGVFLIIFGLLLVGGIDYFLRPTIISKGSSIHPLTAMIGVFGGLKLFGFPGIVIGPMIAALFMALFSFYHEDYMKDTGVGKSNRHGR